MIIIIENVIVTSLSRFPDCSTHFFETSQAFLLDLERFTIGGAAVSQSNTNQILVFDERWRPVKNVYPLNSLS